MFLLRIISKTVFWSYRRGTWQHEFLCLAYIAALIFIPTNSNGWFADGERVELSDGSFVVLHRLDTTLFLTWEKDSPKPDPQAVGEFVTERFGGDAEAILDTSLGPRHFRIVPRGLQ